MIKQYTIIDEAGLHARPASVLVQAASKFSNNITLEFDGKKVNLKSILLIMSLGVPQHSLVSIEVDGNNQKNIFEALEEVLKKYKLVE
jgi:phosphocarrier protein